MRITSFMIFDQLTRSLQRNLEKTSVANAKLASQKKMDKPSDDVIAVMRAMDYKLNINFNEQYKRNINEGINQLEFTEKIMNSVSESLMRAKELALSAASDALNENDRMTIAKEIAHIRDHLLNLSNTRFRGRYIFSGFKTETPSFDSTTFVYNGDNGKINIPIDKGTSVPINVLGSEAFTYGGISFAKILDDIRVALESNDKAVIISSLSYLDNAINQVIDVTTDIGARLNRLDDQLSRLDDSTISFKSLLSETEDIDLTEVVSEIVRAQTALESLRASSARILSQSLMDFLK